RVRFRSAPPSGADGLAVGGSDVGGYCHHRRVPGGSAKWWIPVVSIAMAVSWWWNAPDHSSEPALGRPERAQVVALLGRVTVVPERVRAPGYERGCGPGERCVFGPAWSDDHAGSGGHDGCDTRNNVLARDLR